jgi:hypothetical protein
MISHGTSLTQLEPLEKQRGFVPRQIGHDTRGSLPPACASSARTAAQSGQQTTQRLLATCRCLRSPGILLRTWSSANESVERVLRFRSPARPNSAGCFQQSYLGTIDPTSISSCRRTEPLLLTTNLSLPAICAQSCGIFVPHSRRAQTSRVIPPGPPRSVRHHDRGQRLPGFAPQHGHNPCRLRSRLGS